jgi:hypothetical protein
LSKPVLTTALKTGLMLVLALSVASAEEKIALPCDASEVNVASDGSGLWFTCSQNWAARKGAEREGRQPPPETGSKHNRAAVYWLGSGSNSPVKVASARASISVVEAPKGSDALVVLQQQSAWGQVVLFHREKRLRELPVDAYFLLWSSNASLVYFYGGTNVEADDWNILGIYDLKSGAWSKRKLKEPTSVLRTCPANGHVYSATPPYPGFAGRTLEYTPDLRFIRRIETYVGARFSATCRFVASESEYHGPLPWSIYAVESGKELLHFASVEEQGKEVVYDFVEWNPRHESLLLRKRIPGNGKPDAFEVFDVESKRVLQTIADADVIAWTADGDKIVTCRGNVLTWHALALNRR